MTVENKNIDYKGFFEKGISYDQYLSNFDAEIGLGEKSPYAKYLPQNRSRYLRLDRRFKLREDLQQVVRSLRTSQKWLVITEHWCGDASQILPIISKIALERNDIIDLKMVYRDENLELMDAHLTNKKSRSIPILIRLDDSYNLIDSYGPRPLDAQNLVMDLLENSEEYSVPLHTWYARDKQQSIQDELIHLLS